MGDEHCSIGLAKTKGDTLELYKKMVLRDCKERGLTTVEIYTENDVTWCKWVYNGEQKQLIPIFGLSPMEYQESIERQWGFVLDWIARNERRHYTRDVS